MKAIHIRSRVGTGHAGLLEAQGILRWGRLVPWENRSAVSALVESNCPNPQARISMNSARTKPEIALKVGNSLQ